MGEAAPCHPVPFSLLVFVPPLSFDHSLRLSLSSSRSVSAPLPPHSLPLSCSPILLVHTLRQVWTTYWAPGPHAGNTMTSSTPPRGSLCLSPLADEEAEAGSHQVTRPHKLGPPVLGCRREDQGWETEAQRRAVADWRSHSSEPPAAARGQLARHPAWLQRNHVSLRKSLARRLQGLPDGLWPTPPASSCLPAPRPVFSGADHGNAASLLLRHLGPGTCTWEPRLHACSRTNISSPGATKYKDAVRAFPGGSDGKSVCLQCGRPRFHPWVRQVPWRRKWQPTPLFLPGKFHGQRSLMGYSPRGRKELDMTEQLHFHCKGLKLTSCAVGGSYGQDQKDQKNPSCHLWSTGRSCACPLHSAPLQGWADHLSHASSLTPGRGPSLAPNKEPD